MFTTSYKVRSGTFSCDYHGEIVANYMENLNAFSEQCWKSLLTACSIIQVMRNHGDLPGGSSLEGDQHALYIPSSP